MVLQIHSDFTLEHYEVTFQKFLNKIYIFKKIVAIFFLFRVGTALIVKLKNIFYSEIARTIFVVKIE